MGGGAWPFLVGGVICLVNSVNERDLSLLNSYVCRGNCGYRGLVVAVPFAGEGRGLGQLLRGTVRV